MNPAPQDIVANRDYFRAKLRAERQKADVVTKVAKGEGDFVLLDTRRRADFAKGHIPGALCVPNEELGELISQLPKNTTLVAYCYSHS